MARGHPRRPDYNGRSGRQSHMATRLSIAGDVAVDAAALVAGFPGPAAWLARDGAVRAANAGGRKLLAGLPGAARAAFAAADKPHTQELALPAERGDDAARAIELALVPIADGVLLL